MLSRVILVAFKLVMSHMQLGFYSGSSASWVTLLWEGLLGLTHDYNLYEVSLYYNSFGVCV